jgi:hypothetical protein
MKTMSAVKKVAAVATMWWVVAYTNGLMQGGQPVGIWIGPWETKAACELARRGAAEGRNNDSATSSLYGAPSCYYQTGR